MKTRTYKRLAYDEYTYVAVVVTCKRMVWFYITIFLSPVLNQWGNEVQNHQAIPFLLNSFGLWIIFLFFPLFFIHSTSRLMENSSGMAWYMTVQWLWQHTAKISKKERWTLKKKIQCNCYIIEFEWQKGLNCAN